MWADHTQALFPFTVTFVLTQSPKVKTSQSWSRMTKALVKYCSLYSSSVALLVIAFWYATSLQEFNFLCLFKKLIDIKRHSLLVFQPSASCLSRSCTKAAVMQLCWPTMTPQMVSSRLLAVLQCSTVVWGVMSEYYYPSMMSLLSGIALSFLLTGSCCCIHKLKLNLKIRKVINLTKPAPSLTK